MVTQLLLNWQMPQEVIDSFTRNEITVDHLDLLQNDNDGLKELCPVMGIRMDLKQKIKQYLEAKADTETVSSIDVAETSTFDIIVPNDDNITIPLSDIFTPKISVADFDLKTLLETSPCGKSVLQYYTTHRTLDSKRKNRLTDIIIRHLFTVIINNRLSLDDYNIITGKIISLFPSETAGTYFTKPIKKAESGRGKSVPARGKLVDKVRNVLFQSSERKRNPQTPNETETSKQQRLCEILQDMHKEDLEWLQNNNEPWDEVVIKWNNTRGVRYNSDYGTVQDFLIKWKILKNPRATELITPLIFDLKIVVSRCIGRHNVQSSIKSVGGWGHCPYCLLHGPLISSIKVLFIQINGDFEYLHPGKGQAFGFNWDNFFDKFFKLKEQVFLTDEKKQNLFLTLKDLDTDTKIPTQLTLLANIVPPKGRTSKKSKCSTQECIDSIMIIVEKPGDINKEIENQKENALKQKVQVQPYLIILGSLSYIRKVYLIIDDLQYTFDSVREAFDILFKCFHVLNAKYPIPSEHIHLIIQRCVYKIFTKYDNPVPYIADILNLA